MSKTYVSNLSICIYVLTFRSTIASDPFHMVSAIFFYDLEAIFINSEFLLAFMASLVPISDLLASFFQVGIGRESIPFQLDRTQNFIFQYVVQIWGSSHIESFEISSGVHVKDYKTRLKNDPETQSTVSDRLRTSHNDEIRSKSEIIGIC